jgi:hypothetical protein
MFVNLLGSIAAHLASCYITVITTVLHNCWVKNLRSHLLNRFIREQLEWLGDSHRRDSYVRWIAEISHHDDLFWWCECEMLGWVEVLHLGLFFRWYVLDNWLEVRCFKVHGSQCWHCLEGGHFVKGCREKEQRWNDIQKEGSLGII